MNYLVWFCFTFSWSQVELFNGRFPSKHTFIVGNYVEEVEDKNVRKCISLVCKLWLVQKWWTVELFFLMAYFRQQAEAETTSKPEVKVGKLQSRNTFESRHQESTDTDSAKVKYLLVRHVTGTGSGLLGGIPRVVVQISALTLKGPL